MVPEQFGQVLALGDARCWAIMILEVKFAYIVFLIYACLFTTRRQDCNHVSRHCNDVCLNVFVQMVKIFFN